MTEQILTPRFEQPACSKHFSTLTKSGRVWLVLSNLMDEAISEQAGKKARFYISDSIKKF